MRSGYLGLGSNVGDREAELREAVRDLREGGVNVCKVSSVYETEPVGELLEQPDFLNAVVHIRTELEPEPLLRLCKRIEFAHGRSPEAPRHAPRGLDIDLLLLGDLVFRSERLILPHPQLSSRRFVLAPLLELEPELRLPDGTELAAVLAGLGPGQRVERLGSL